MAFESTLRCNWCGREISRQVVLCPWCHNPVKGAPLWNQRKPDPRLEIPALSIVEQRKHRDRRRALVVAAFLVAFAVLVVAYFVLLRVPEIGPGENSGTAADSSSP